MLLRLAFAFITTAVLFGIGYLMRDPNPVISLLLATLLQLLAFVVLFYIYLIIKFINKVGKKCPHCNLPRDRRQNHIMQSVEVYCKECGHCETV